MNEGVIKLDKRISSPLVVEEPIWQTKLGQTSLTVSLLLDSINYGIAKVRLIITGVWLTRCIGCLDGRPFAPRGNQKDDSDIDRICLKTITGRYTGMRDVTISIRGPCSDGI